MRRGTPYEERVAKRQGRLVELARDIAFSAGKDLDDNDARALLRAIVRRWSTTETAVYRSRAVARGIVHREHVVPVRVLVDRMIAKPRCTERLLRSCIVIAEVTPTQHRKIGTMVGTHADLYEDLQSCVIDDLVPLSWRRYSSRGINVFDDRGRSPY
jgi:hypothetical protein